MADPVELLDQLDQAHAAATPGPWFAWNRGVGWHLAVEDPSGVDHLPGRPELVPEGSRTDLARAEDAALIVAAVNALPRLTSALRAVLGLADELDEQSAEAADRAEAARKRGDRVMYPVNIRQARVTKHAASSLRAALSALDGTA